MYFSLTQETAEVQRVVNCGVHPSLHYLNLDDTIRIGYEYDAAIAQNPTFTNFKVIIYIFFP
jgi:hypothetical protein